MEKVKELFSPPALDGGFFRHKFTVRTAEALATRAAEPILSADMVMAQRAVQILLPDKWSGLNSPLRCVISSSTLVQVILVTQSYVRP